MRRAAKVDATQPDIVKAFRKLGYVVLHIHQLKNCFDLLICCSRTANIYCIECKDGSLPPSQRKLTDGEKKFHESWPAPVYIIESVDDVLKFHGIVGKV